MRKEDSLIKRVDVEDEKGEKRKRLNEEKKEKRREGRMEGGRE